MASSRYLRVAGGYTKIPLDALNEQGQTLDQCEPGSTHTFSFCGMKRRARVTPLNFDPCRDDPHNSAPGPDDPAGAVTGGGGSCD